MKKILSLILVISYIMFYATASGIASELYLIKNAQKESVLPIIQTLVKNDSYTIKSNDPVYGIKGAFEIISILQQSDADLYYYNSSNDITLSKNILSSIKKAGYSYKKNRDDALSLSFAQSANSLKKTGLTETKKYDFDDKEITLNTKNNNSAANSDSDDSLRGYVAQIPSGTTFDVYMQTTINTASAGNGDPITAVLVRNWEYNGLVVAGQGSTLTGYVTKAHSAGKAYRNGYVKFNFNKLTTVEGKTYNLSTEDIEFKVDSTGKAADAAGKVVGSVIVGALAGLIIGAISKDVDLGKSVAIGAGAGAAWGAGSAVMEEGSDAEIPVYTELSVKLVAPLKAVLSY